MDILIKLRALMWALVIGLWGLMIYQFLEEEEAEVPRMQWVSKQFAEEESLPALAEEPRIPLDQLFPPKPIADEELTAPASPVRGTRTGGKLARIPSSLGTVPRPHPGSLTKPVIRRGRDRPVRVLSPEPEEKPKTRKKTKPRRTKRKPKPAVRPPRPEAPTPEGFVKRRTAHFTVYSEGKRPSLEFLETLEALHGNIMLDLAAFSPWGRDQRVTIFLFRSQESYRRVTGRPAWSGGASSVRRRKIYLYETEELVGILAHELTHIYFDSFFLASGGNPLWLSEGMATLVQTERGQAAPNWLRPNLKKLRRGDGYKLKELMKVEETSSASDKDIRLWYAQSYSVVRFLIRSQYRSSFYKFCAHIRDGMPIKDALYRAYGMPYNRIKALEYAWRHNLKS